MARVDGSQKETVAKGAALLDEILPGWHRSVKPERLKMEDGALCMMGQLFGRDVEGRLAREMYPKQFTQFDKDNKHLAASSDGYGIAMCFGGDRDNGILDDILSKNGMDAEVEEAIALRAACAGYDNKCLWAEEVAERLAKDESEAGDA